jgi:hypothetical protein
MHNLGWSSCGNSAIDEEFRFRFFITRVDAMGVYIAVTTRHMSRSPEGGGKWQHAGAVWGNH